VAPAATPRDVHPPEAPKGPETVVVGIVFSNDARRGERTTGALVTDPARYEKRPDLVVLKATVRLPKGPDGKPILTGTTVTVGGGPAQPADGPLICDVPRGPKGGVTPVTLHPSGGPAIPAGGVPVSEVPSATAPVGISAPPLFSAGEPVRILWRFDGDASDTNVSVAGRPARVIAETSRDCVVEIPADVPPGPVEVLVTERGRTRRMKANVIRVKASAEQPDLPRGQSTKFQVVVEGLNGIPDIAWDSGPDQGFVDRALLERTSPGTRIPGPTEPGYVLLTIESVSPATLSLAKSTGGLIRLVIKKIDVGPKGTFTYHGVARSTGDGRFDVRATVFALIGPPTGEYVP
jgi:hypothetical protein